VQQLYRRTGRHPTEAATRARMAKRQQQHSLGAAAPLAVVAPRTSSPISSAVHQGRGSEWFPTGNAASFADALARNQPIGRRERLVHERNRR
jgi:hypothetical protein